MKIFNTTSPCIPEKHYMVDLSSRLAQIKDMVDAGQYFVINRARQYGKTTTLFALKKFLKDSYVVLSLDFQGISSGGFRTEESFVKAFCRMLLARSNEYIPEDIASKLRDYGERQGNEALLDELFVTLLRWCKESDKPVVLMIDEVDSATNNQVFLDFLAQLRDSYINRDTAGNPTFQSVILAGVTDIKNLRRKIRPEEAHRFNSPWNIAADFKIDMSFSADEIAGMLHEYETDHGTGMNVKAVAQEIYNFTSGYPFLVSRICQLIDREKMPWTVSGVGEAVGMMIDDRSLLFESLMNKVKENDELSKLLQKILFVGDEVAYNRYITTIDDAEMYGFIKKDGKKVAIFNRIFETLLYDFYLLSQSMDAIFQKGINEKSRFVIDGHLQMEVLLERFIVTFDDLYGEHSAKNSKNLRGKKTEDVDTEETFDEEEGRRRFLLFVRAVINGTGNYYIEARTRSQTRIDVVIDYLGEQFVVELKIWRGNAYNERGEEQLAAYLDDFHLKKGYMLSYNFNKIKTQGIRHIKLGDRELVEAIV